MAEPHRQQMLLSPDAVRDLLYQYADEVRANRRRAVAAGVLGALCLVLAAASGPVPSALRLAGYALGACAGAAAVVLAVGVVRAESAGRAASLASTLAEALPAFDDPDLALPLLETALATRATAMRAMLGNALARCLRNVRPQPCPVPRPAGDAEGRPRPQRAVEALAAVGSL